MKTLRKFTVWLCAISLLYGCTSEGDHLSVQNSNFKNVNGRIVFADEAAALSVITELSNKSTDELIQWEKKNNFQSLRSVITSADTIAVHYPDGIAAMLNVKGEYQIGESIIWIHNNYIFTLPNKDENLLKQIKSNPENLDFVMFRNLFMTEMTAASADNGRVIPNQPSYTTTFQYTAAHLFRFVRHLFNVYAGGGVQQLYFENVLQYKANNGAWYQASEPVNYRYIGGFNFSFDPGFTYSPQAAYGDLSQVNGILKVVAATASSPFPGSVGATFQSQIWSDYANQWFIFNQYITWY